MRPSCLALVAAALFVAIPLAGQVPQSDPQGLTLATQSMMAMTGGLPVNDVTLAGTAARFAGSDQETGTVTLKALGTQESQINLNLQAGNRVEDRVVGSDGPQTGYWSGPDRATHPMAFHNCWTDAGWFFPPLSSLAGISNPNLVVSYLGHETHEGVAVEHLRFLEYFPLLSTVAAGLVEHLSTVDFYLDSTSLLPVAMAFNMHPDDDAGIDIPVEIRFSNYQLVSGVRVPFRIQKFVQGSLTLDVSLNAVALNTGLTDSAFSIP